MTPTCLKCGRACERVEIAAGVESYQCCGFVYARYEDGPAVQAAMDSWARDNGLYWHLLAA